MELLTHVNRRLEAHPHLNLPTVALLDIFGSPDTGALTRNVALTYLEQAFARAAPDLRFDLVHSNSSNQVHLLKCSRTILQCFDQRRN